MFLPYCRLHLHSKKSAHFCSSPSGNVTVETQILNCQRSGGIAAIIYNNEPGKIKERLSNSTGILNIPALQTSSFHGEKLASVALGTTLVIEEKMGYGYSSGTSMAAPHVTGVIAKIWRMVRRLCLITYQLWIYVLNFLFFSPSTFALPYLKVSIMQQSRNREMYSQYSDWSWRPRKRWLIRSRISTSDTCVSLPKKYNSMLLTDVPIDGWIGRPSVPYANFSCGATLPARI